MIAAEALTESLATHELKLLVVKADDIDLVEKFIISVENSFNTIVGAKKKVVLKVNDGKMKYMCKTEHIDDTDLNKILESKLLKKRKRFEYFEALPTTTLQKTKHVDAKHRQWQTRTKKSSAISSVSLCISCVTLSLCL